MIANGSLNATNLDDQLKRIYDHLFANASVRTPTAIAAEVGKILRTASFMEGDAGLFPAFSFEKSLRRKLLDGDRTSTSKLASEVRERLREMNAGKNLYSEPEFLLGDADLAWCCAQLDAVVVSAGKRDVFGDAVEILRTNWAKQNSGQFFTDSRVTHLAVSLLRFDPLSGDDFVDICCGTGGFLLAALDRMRICLAQSPSSSIQVDSLGRLAASALKGQEIDPEIQEIANASIGIRTGTSGVEFVRRGDSLSPSAFSKDSLGLREGAHLCVASNPPFGTKITIKDRETLKHYELAHSSGNSPSPRAPDILLLERNVRMLRPGEGRLAIVLPYQILSGPQTRYIREWLLRETHLTAVIDLPAETFQPHTGTKTSLLVLRRRRKPNTGLGGADEETVYMATPQWIGHDRRGKPVYRVRPDGRKSDEILSDIEAVASAFEVFLAKGQPEKVFPEAFAVPLSRIIADPELRLNARYYRHRPIEGSSPRNSSAWKTARLGDVCGEIFCPPRFKRHYVEASERAVPFIGGAGISDLMVDTNKWLDRGDPHLPGLIVREGWLLVTRSGTTGIVASVPRAWDGFAVSEHVIRIVPDSHKLSPAWLYAYLKSERGQSQIARGVFGSVIDEITPDFLANLEIPIPTKKTKVESVVGAVAEAESARQVAIENFLRAKSAMQGYLLDFAP